MKSKRNNVVLFAFHSNPFRDNIHSVKDVALSAVTSTGFIHFGTELYNSFPDVILRPAVVFLISSATLQRRCHRLDHYKRIEDRKTYICAKSGTLLHVLPNWLYQTFVSVPVTFNCTSLCFMHFIHNISSRHLEQGMDLLMYIVVI